MIYAGRLLCGLSVGAVTVAVPLYSYDVAPDECRGRGGVFLDLMLCAGILYSYAVSSVAGLPAFSFTCGLVPVAFCALFAFMPESPRHLYTAGRYVDAKSALMWVSVIIAHRTRSNDFDEMITLRDRGEHVSAIARRLDTLECLNFSVETIARHFEMSSRSRPSMRALAACSQV